ncbi:MAG: GGDEF domain-containing protein [Oscillospiraceae bacterium]|nr:GGDEF domain-containing protein [Oscillospiraceae bacterium]
MKRSDIQVRLYKAILLSGMGLSMICILGNCLGTFPLQVNFKWFGLFCVCTAALFFSHHKTYRAHTMFAVFAFIIFLFLPFAFFNSGGSNNNAIGYTFLVLICIIYLFSGWQRYFFVFGLTAVFTGLHAVEYLHPDLIVKHTEWSQFIDRMIQIPLLLLASFFIILQFAKEYERVNDQLDQCANVDPLTGLYNRRMFNTAIERATAERHTTPYLVLIDVDNFKKANDIYGHSEGDKVLQKLSELLLQFLGFGRNIVSRWGGDEFAIIYYGDRKDLTRRLDEVKELFGAYVLLHNKEADISFSDSSVPAKGTADKILMQADRILYQEKKKKHLSCRSL